MTSLFNMVTPLSCKKKTDDTNISLIFTIIKTYGCNSKLSFVVKLSSSDRPSE